MMICRVAENSLGWNSCYVRGRSRTVNIKPTKNVLHIALTLALVWSFIPQPHYTQQIRSSNYDIAKKLCSVLLQEYIEQYTKYYVPHSGKFLRGGGFNGIAVYILVLHRYLISRMRNSCWLSLIRLNSNCVCYLYTSEKYCFQVNLTDAATKGQIWHIRKILIGIYIADKIGIYYVL